MLVIMYGRYFLMVLDCRVAALVAMTIWGIMGDGGVVVKGKMVGMMGLFGVEAIHLIRLWRNGGCHPSLRFWR